MKQLILASQSPRRAKILESLNIPFEIVKTDALETSFPNDPVRTVRENAANKLSACKENHPSSPILAADTIVWYNDKIYGKPCDLNEARQMLKELSGQTHIVFTGVAYTSGDGKIQTKVCKSSVTFKTLSDELIEEYVESTKPTDRAGAYDIDENGDKLIERFDGEYENIMGLPVEPLKEFSLCND
ncbi:MAG: septum formation protein Maf [Kiritimatiellae bacterium]|nr:septum formation protein Maf [Kiritimatiellia bacterium]